MSDMYYDDRYGGQDPEDLVVDTLRSQIDILKKENNKLKGVMKELDQFFTSGNEIPIDRATIPREKYLSWLQSLDRKT